jgi:hypothetical protein
VFTDPDFPARTFPILFASTGALRVGSVCPTWRRIAEVLLDGR